MLSTVEKVLFLKSIDLFSQIPGEDLAAIALISSEESRDQADGIFAEGESGDALYLVIDGKVRVHATEPGQPREPAPEELLGQTEVSTADEARPARAAERR